jgi:hypothetical protein
MSPYSALLQPCFEIGAKDAKSSCAAYITERKNGKKEGWCLVFYCNMLILKNTHPKKPETRDRQDSEIHPS